MPIVPTYHKYRLQIPFTSFGRYIYARKHVQKDSNGNGVNEFAPDRTLFISNIPNGMDDKCLREMFQKFGSIQYISMGKRHNENTSTFAHIVFKTSKGLKQALATSVLETCESYDKRETGLEALKSNYTLSRPSRDELFQKVESYMKEFSAKEEDELNELKSLKNHIDEDGFKMVVNPKKRRMTEAVALPTAPVKKKNKELVDFYRFQMREKKRDEIKTLRERFEEDKKLVEQIKERKQYRPQL